MKRQPAFPSMIALRLMLVVGLVVGQVAVMTVGAPAKPAHALTTIITQWTFTGNVTAPSTGSGIASLVGSDTNASFATGLTGGSTDRAWNTTNYPTQGTNNKQAGVQFQISTIGWQDIEFSFNIRHSNTAANTVVVQYSTNGGTSFTDVATYTVNAGDQWYTRTVDLTTYPVSNVASLQVRVVAAFAPPTNTQYVASNYPTHTNYSTGGTLRFDNVTFRGNAIASDAAPAVSAVNPPNGATNVPVSSNVVITFSEPVTVTGDWFSLACVTSGTRTPSASNVTFTGGPTIFTLDPTADFAQGEMCTLTVVANQVSDQDTDDPPDNMAADFTSSFTTQPPLPDICTNSNHPALTPINQVQSNTLTSPLSGTQVTVRGIVVGDFETSAQLSGFYIQSEPALDDGAPSTSEGLFVFNGIGVTQLAGGHSGDEPSNGGWPPGGWLPWPHTNSPLSATDTPPAAKRLARPEANDPEWRRLCALAPAPPHSIASALDDRPQSPIPFSPTPLASPLSSSGHWSPSIPRPRFGKPSEIPGQAQSPSDAPPAPPVGFPPPESADSPADPDSPDGCSSAGSGKTSRRRR
jgi:hypothetical protein